MEAKHNPDVAGTATDIDEANLASQNSTAEADTPAQTSAEAVTAEQWQAAQEKIQSLEESWLRAKAETENVRRRAAEDNDKARKFAVEKFASELLAVKDSLEIALTIENATQDSLKDGVVLTLKQLSSAFEKHQLLEINPLNEKLDPHRHQAISVVESDAEANTVVAVLQKGYLLSDRVLRPALVSVAKPKA